MTDNHYDDVDREARHDWLDQRPPGRRRSFEIPEGAIERAEAEQRAEQQAAELTWRQERANRAALALDADGETICRSCGTPLLWATGPGGGDSVPINREPDPEGTMGVHPETGEWLYGQPRLVPGQESLLDAEPPKRWRLHYETCPDARRWREYGQRQRALRNQGDR